MQKPTKLIEVTRRASIGAAITAVCTVSAPAHAESLLWLGQGYYSGGNNSAFGSTYDSAQISYAPPPGFTNQVVNGGSVLAGADKMQVTASGGPDPLNAILATYCVDVLHPLTNVDNISGTSYSVYSDTSSTTTGYFGGINGLTGSTIVHNIEELATLELGNVTNSATSAAFQLAVWKLSYESNLASNPTLATGIFTATPGTPADITLANTWVAAALNATGPVTENLNFYFDSSMGPAGNHFSQHLITFTAVPLPATAWMLLSGLAGLFGAARSRRSAI